MKTVIKGGLVINEGKKEHLDILIENGRITKMAANISEANAEEINADGKYVLPGCIDDQVHFREPGLTHKANIGTESRAAVAGGITTFMEMPNTVPNALTQKLLQDKYDIAANTSIANYSFFMGASNDNIEHVLQTDPHNVCGVKVFMGSSTGNMLVDETATLEKIFSEVPMLIATHCEDEATIRRNTEIYREKYGEDMSIKYHPEIRSEEACYLSSSKAVELAKKFDTRLHILHISTGKETELFRNDIPLKEKRITAEACVHHLWFTDEFYDEKGTFIKWNPAVKSAADRDQIWKALLDNRIDIVATDHAPHTLEEKANKYFSAPSGGPLVQHALLAMLEKSKDGIIPLERVVEKMAHAPADCFQVKERGYLREGYFADIVIVDPKLDQTVTRESLLYKCGWSPFEGTKFSHVIDRTIVNGKTVYHNNAIVEAGNGQRITFDR